MTDLQQLLEWHQNEAAYHRDISQIETGAEIYAETARILSVLLRVREGCRIRFAAADTDSAGCTIPAELEFTGPADTLRALTELLERE